MWVYYTFAAEKRPIGFGIYMQLYQEKKCLKYLHGSCLSTITSVIISTRKIETLWIIWRKKPKTEN